MQLDRFKHEFKRLNGVYATDKVVLFRNPLELYSLTTGNGKEIAIHNHPRDGWPTFSKEDVINTALGTRRGIVAVSTKTGRGDDTARYAGVYTFTKGTHFNASGFVKAVNSAQLSGKDYNDAVSKWLKANQQKFGYKYSYQKAK